MEPIGLATSTSSSVNASSRRLPSRAEIEAWNHPIFLGVTVSKPWNSNAQQYCFGKVHWILLEIFLRGGFNFFL
jgi:hypothetical protein